MFSLCGRALVRELEAEETQFSVRRLELPSDPEGTGRQRGPAPCQEPVSTIRDLSAASDSSCHLPPQQLSYFSAQTKDNPTLRDTQHEASPKMTEQLALWKVDTARGTLRNV